MNSQPLTEKTFLAPAKLNLALSVGAPLTESEKSGYHPIASWMVALEFGDRVLVRRAEKNQSTFKIRFADDAPVKQQVDWPVEKDLACKAHQLLEQKTAKKLPVDVEIQKYVPAGAGLAGGSADAAAVLCAVHQMYELDISDDELVVLAGGLGCDVAFSLAALQGRMVEAVATGLGQNLEAVHPPRPGAQADEPAHFVIVLPQFSCATADVYQAFDNMLDGDDLPKVDTQLVRDLAQQRPIESEFLFNDLVAGAITVAPDLLNLLAQVQRATEQIIHVTGSGSAIFMLADSAAHAQHLAKCVEQKVSGVSVVRTRTRRLEPL